MNYQQAVRLLETRLYRSDPYNPTPLDQAIAQVLPILRIAAVLEAAGKTPLLYAGKKVPVGGGRPSLDTSFIPARSSEVT